MTRRCSRRPTRYAACPRLCLVVRRQRNCAQLGEAGMTVTERKVEEFSSGLGGARFHELFDLLESYGLRPIGKSNTETLLYQRHRRGATPDGIFAFRKGAPHVISFPKSYWLPRVQVMNEILDRFDPSDRPPIRGPVSETQYSAGQVSIRSGTLEAIRQFCGEVCDRLD